MKTILTILTLILIGCGNSKNLTSTKKNSAENNEDPIGKFKVGVFEDCGPGGVENVTYKYRIGNWIFYHPNGQIKAIVKYKPIQTEISTRCEINEKIEFSVLDNDWKLFDDVQDSYSINPSRSYLIQDQQGFYYKLRFTDFYNNQGERGYSSFEFQKL